MMDGPKRCDRGDFELSAGLIHVWDGIAAIEAPQFPDFYALLDPSERQRADRFRFEQHRIRFVICRGWLRLLLSAYTGQAPAAIELIANEHGKPRLIDHPPNRGLVFNVSHSGDRMVFAFGLDCRLGVDIEQIRDMPHLEDIVERICAKSERAAWREIAKDNRLEYFFKAWVRKEAIIKAQGRGLSLGMQPCELADTLERPVRLPECCGLVQDWVLFDLSYAEEYRGAVAVNRSSSMVCRALPQKECFDLYLCG
ncbi:MAG: 4'-phosphopantetheinyl transferase family protein [Methylococcales bacterium]